MTEDIQNILRAEEKAIVALQDTTYRLEIPRQDSRLQHARASYEHLMHKYFPRNSSAKIAYEHTTERIADVADKQHALEEGIRTERFELKSPTHVIPTTPSAPHISLKDPPQTSETFHKPQKNKAFSQSFLSPSKKQKPHSLELSSELLERLKTKFNQYIEEKRRLQLRANTLLSRLGIFKKKLTPITVSGVKEVSSPSPSL